MNFNEQIKLGRSGLSVGRLGLAYNYGAPPGAYETAFERGCNYLTCGTFKAGAMNNTIKKLAKSGKREKMVVALYSSTHLGFLTGLTIPRKLKQLGLDYADVLILGYYPGRPSDSVIEGALKLKKKGIIRSLAISSHNTSLFAELKKENIFDIFHIRYSAALRSPEKKAFPFIGGEDRPGVVTYTATRWRKLLKQGKMPAGEKAPTAADCYRFVLSNPSVDLCMTGPSSMEQMKENLTVLDQGPMSEEELIRIRKIGDYVH